MKGELAGKLLAPLLIAAALVVSGPLRAQEPQEIVPPPRFDITRFEVVGTSLLTAEEIERIVSPYTGKNKDFADIQRALESLEQAFRDRGYGVVQVQLPEQDITRGVVQLRVLQPRIGRVTIEDNKHFDAKNIRNSLPPVKEGETPNSREMARTLQQTAEHPVKQTNVLLKSGASEELVDVNIKVTDDKPTRYFFTLDNTGTSDTGYLRTGFGFQHSNLFNRDHQFTATYITSPEYISDVTIVGLGYRIPYYHLNSTLDLIAGYSNVNSGLVQNLFNVSGSGTIGAVRWNYFLPKWDEIEQKVALGLDYRAFKNEVVLQGQALVPDITIHPASVTYSGVKRMTAAEISFYGGLVTNIPGGNDGQAQHFQASRAGATENYTLARLGMNYTRQFRNESQMRFAVNGQMTGDSLISGEQYGAGGPDSVRGYNMREVSGDRGYSGQIEFYTPDLSSKFGLGDSYKTRLLAFYDWGWVRYNNESPTGFNGDTISSLGVGLRMTYGKTVSLRFDIAQIMQDSPNREKSSQRVNGALALVF